MIVFDMVLGHVTCILYISIAFSRKTQHLESPTVGLVSLAYDLRSIVEEVFYPSYCSLYTSMDQEIGDHPPR